MTDKKLKREYIAQEYSYDEYYPTHKLTRDAEPIVRCWSCNYWHKNPLHPEIGRCELYEYIRKAWNDFCSEGDLKE